MSKLEELRPQVKEIARAAKAIRATGISERALLLLLQHSCGTVNSGRGPKMISQKVLTAVLDGMESLEEFVFEEEE